MTVMVNNTLDVKNASSFGISVIFPFVHSFCLHFGALNIYDLRKGTSNTPF